MENPGRPQNSCWVQTGCSNRGLFFDNHRRDWLDWCSQTSFASKTAGTLVFGVCSSLLAHTDPA